MFRSTSPVQDRPVSPPVPAQQQTEPPAAPALVVPSWFAVRSAAEAFQEGGHFHAVGSRPRLSVVLRPVASLSQPVASVSQPVPGHVRSVSQGSRPASSSSTQAPILRLHGETAQLDAEARPAMRRLSAVGGPLSSAERPVTQVPATPGPARLPVVTPVVTPAGPATQQAAADPLAGDELYILP